MSDQKKIFISYSWDSPDHRKWVKKFCDDLQACLGKYFEVLLDQNQKRGTSLSRFMKLGLKDAVKVLIIGTPKYKEKSEANGGVAYETMVITNEMMSDMDTTKFYPILRSGTFETSFPTDIKDRMGDDFSDDKYYEENLQIVVKEIIEDNPIPDIFKQESTTLKAIKDFEQKKEIKGQTTEINASEDHKSVVATTASHNISYSNYVDITPQLNSNSSFLTGRKIEINDSINGVKFSKNRKILIRFPKDRKGAFILPNYVTKIGNNAFKDCSDITSIVIPDSVTEIGNFAFTGCTSITFIAIPNSVTEIGEGAFSNCTSLFSIKIPERVNSIKRETFSSCTSLSAIDIPESVKGIGEAAFSGCNISIIHLRNKVPVERSYYAIGIEKTKTTLFVPKGSEDVYRDNMYYDHFKDIIGE